MLYTKSGDVCFTRDEMAAAAKVQYLSLKQNATDTVFIVKITLNCFFKKFKYITWSEVSYHEHAMILK